MRINKFIFPFILLVIFFGVITLGMTLGYWETKGGGGSGGQGQHDESAFLIESPLESLASTERNLVTWQL